MHDLSQIRWVNIRYNFVIRVYHPDGRRRAGAAMSINGDETAGWAKRPAETSFFVEPAMPLVVR
jgi:hypothetical protein